MNQRQVASQQAGFNHNSHQPQRPPSMAYTQGTRMLQQAHAGFNQPPSSQSSGNRLPTEHHLQQGPAHHESSIPQQLSGEKRLQLTVYGTKCAFQVEPSSTRKDGWHTVNIESASKANPNNPNERAYNWSQKVVIQMTQSELPLFIAVTLGMLPGARFDLHGDNNKKFLDVINQNENFFLKSGDGTRMNVTPVPIVDAYQFGTLALTQYVKNFPGMTPEAALQIIGRMSYQLSQSGAYKQPQPRNSR